MRVDAMRTGLTKWMIAVRMLCALAILSVGFAHRMPAALAAPALPSLTVYALPDGSMPVLCLPGTPDDSGKGKTFAGKNCEACRLAASMLLPEPPASLPVLHALVRETALPVVPETVHHRLFPPNLGPRAPPVSAAA